MRVLELKGVRIGEGRPKAIVSLMDTDIDSLVHTYRKAVASGADMVEWRADFWPNVLEPQSVADVCQTLREQCQDVAPYVFTCRTAGQGGTLDIDVDTYIQILTAAITLGTPDVVDIELCCGDDVVRRLTNLAHEHGVAVIVSHHDFSGTPATDEMVQLLVHMAELGADIPKLAVMPGNTQDPRHLMQATDKVRKLVDAPLLTLAMGIGGQHTRLSGEVFGSALTFCALGQPSAPGQVELTEAIALMDAMHRQLMQQN